MAQRPWDTDNIFEVALSLGHGAMPVYFRLIDRGAEVINPETGESQTISLSTFRARYVTLHQQMPDHLRAKARSVPSYREWRSQRGRGHSGEGAHVH